MAVVSCMLTLFGLLLVLVLVTLVPEKHTTQVGNKRIAWQFLEYHKIGEWIACSLL